MKHPKIATFDIAPILDPGFDAIDDAMLLLAERDADSDDFEVNECMHRYRDRQYNA